jgi:hypothetical protein
LHCCLVSLCGVLSAIRSAVAYADLSSSAAAAFLLSARLAIGDLGTQYFADRGIFCAGRVADEDLQRVAKATGSWQAFRTWMLHLNIGLSFNVYLALCQQLNVCCGWHVQSLICSVVLHFAQAMRI